MKRIALSFLLMLFTGLIQAGHTPLNLDSILTGAYRPAYVPSMYPMADAQSYAALSADGRKLQRFDYKTGALKETLIDLDNAKGETLKRMIGFQFSPQENRLLIWETRQPVYRRSWVTSYYVYDRKRNRIEPLSERTEQRNALFSPDGRSIAFASGNNLYIKRLDFGSELAVTTDGLPNTCINGTADWVYEEEFSVTGLYDWSPDGQYLAYLKFDESKVSDYTFPLYGAFRSGKDNPDYYPSFQTFKYPSAGGQNSTVSLHVYHLQTRSNRALSLPVEADTYFPRIRFTRKLNQLAVMCLNRGQNSFKLYFLNVKSGVASLALTDQNDTYVDPVYDAIQFTTRYFTYLSEKSGYRHLYLYSANGSLLKTLTTGQWDVTRFVGCDTINDRFFYQAAKESPMERSLWQVDLKGKTTRLGAEDGSTMAAFNSDYSLYVKTNSALNRPPRVSLVDLKGKEWRVLTDNAALRQSLENCLPNRKTFITVPAADGTPLNGWVLKPPVVEPGKRYPAILLQYSGPDAQEVVDQFKFDWEYYLAEQGFVVISVDGRGTGGRGADFRRTTYRRLGELEAKDQIAVAGYLKQQSFVDGDRLGIWGWSYGGYITLLALTSPHQPFKAGIAVAPVCDYRYYNTVYTERYMRTPAENEAGYNANSPLLRAGSLTGRLLLVHGLADDNVRANQSLDMAEALIQAGVRFDSQFYPTSNHSILGEAYRKHLFHTKVEFFVKHL
jgi:dipeptidyl-peptidase-4